MGTLYYGAARTAVSVDDRTLTHLKVIITAKLRRNEAFLLSWNEKVETGGGRGSLWVHPGCDIVYRFDGSRTPEIDKALLEEMSTAANSNSGLRISEANMAPITSRISAI